METLVASATTRLGRRLAAALAVAATLVALAAAPVASRPLGECRAFLPIFLTLAASADALTALLLASQARSGRSLPVLILAGGYLFSALAIVVQSLVFPGVFAPAGLLGAGTQTATWFWVWWHGGFPLFAAAYASAVRLRRHRRAPRELPAATSLAYASAIVAAVVALAYVTLRLGAWLPVIIRKGHYGLLVSTGVGPGVLTVIALALVAVVGWTRLRTITDLWLAVALYASLLDCAITLVAGGRFTAGWYVARFESLCTSSVVLLMLLVAIERVLERLALLSRLDGLTEIANRRAFDEELEVRVAGAARTGRPLSLLMIDIDHFKHLNDRHGHACGDEALQTVARTIARALVRRGDFTARYGGEEFAVLLSATDAAAAASIAERVRAHVAATRVAHDASETGFVTVSVGIETLDGISLGADAARRLVDGADGALYRAKAAGRDRVVAARETPLAPVTHLLPNAATA